MASAPIYIENKIAQRQVVLFSKNTCPECDEVKYILSKYKVLTNENYEVVEVDKRTDCSEFQDYLWKLSGMTKRTMPLLFINGHVVGGYDDILRWHRENRLNIELKTRLHALDPAPLEEEQIIFTIAEIDQTDIVVQLVESFYGPCGDEEDERTVDCVPHPGFDPWQDIPVQPSQSDVLSVMMSFMDDESSQLDLMRRSVSSPPGDSTRDINVSSELTLSPQGSISDVRRLPSKEIV